MTRGLAVPRPAVVPAIELADGREVRGFVEEGYGAIMDDRDRRVGFAYLGDQMGGYGDARARELTVALRASLGA